MKTLLKIRYLLAYTVIAMIAGAAVILLQVPEIILAILALPIFAAALKQMRRSYVSMTVILLIVFIGVIVSSAKPLESTLGMLIVMPGVMVATFFMNRSVSRRKQIEETLRESQEEYKRIIDSASDIIYRTDLAGRFTFYNPTVKQVLGYADGELLGHPFTEIVPPTYRKQTSTFYRQQLKDRVAGTYYEFPVIAKDGRLVWVGQNVQLIFQNDRCTGFQAVARDITQRQLTEDALRESESKNRALLNAIPDLIFTLSRDGVYLDYHVAAPSRLLIEPEKFIGKHLVDVMPRQIGQMLQSQIERALETGTMQMSEFPLVSANATQHYEVRMIAYGDKVVALTRDITERKNREAELNRRLRETTLLNRVVSAATSAIDPEAVLQIVCEELARGLNVPLVRGTLIDYDLYRLKIAAEYSTLDTSSELGTYIPIDNNSATEYVIQNRAPLISPDVETDPRMVPVRDLARRHQIVSMVLLPLLVRNQVIGTISLNETEPREFIEEEIELARNVAAAVSQALDNANLFTAAQKELVQRKKAEDLANEQRDFANQVMNTMGQGLTITDEHDRFEFVNPAFARMLGYVPKELIGKTSLDTVFPEDYPILAHAHALRIQGQSNAYEIRLKRADGEPIHTLVTGVPRTNEKSSAAIAVITDLTERKQMEQALGQARDQAMEASRLKSEFLATMSHEIRTPMNSIVGMTELLLADQLTHQQHENALVVQQSAMALLTIINDILDFSKIEAGKFALDHQDFDLPATVEGAVELLAARAHEKGLALMSFISPDIPPNLGGDPGRLRQILVNLIGNAVKFTEHGQVIVRVELRAQAQNDVTVRFAVTDTGIGISDHARKRLFQPFTQADGSTTRKYGGTGLGLVICKRLVELMNGEIGVDSEEGKGSTFWFTARLERATPKSQIKTDLRGLSILVVDDIASHRDILTHYVSSWGMKATSAANGTEALEHLRTAARQHPFDIAVIDLRMPDMDGWMLARAIKQEARIAATHLILLTAFDERGIGEQALQAGFGAYLTKPVRQSYLFDAIAHVIITQPDAHPEPLVTPAPSPIESLDTLVLLAEDNLINQKVATLQLTKLGYRVQTVSNGRAAVQAALDDDKHYALVLMDCQMPEMDGFEATRAIRKMESATGRHIPIIAMTANAMEGDRDQCIAAGMDDYISKPVNLASLAQVLERWVKNEQGVEA